MSTILSPAPKLQFFTEGGIPLAGGKLYSYAAGTTTPLATYTTSSGLQNNTNPVILDSRGEAAVWLGSAYYKMTLTDSNDVEIWTVDNISSQEALNALAAFEALLAGSTGSTLVGFTQTGPGTTRTVQSKLSDSYSVADFGFSTSASAAANAAAFVNAWNVSRQLTIPAGTYNVTGLPNFAILGARIYGIGRVVLNITGAGPGLIVDAGPTPGVVVQDIVIDNLTINCTGAAGLGVLIRGITHSQFNRLRPINFPVGAMECYFMVSNTFYDFCYSGNEPGIITPTVTGIGLAARGPVEQCANCTWINTIVEGTSGNGINLDSAYLNTFIGGTSEGNGYTTGTGGILIGTSSIGNTFIGMALEANGIAGDASTYHIKNAGLRTTFINIFADNGINPSTGLPVWSPLVWMYGGNTATFYSGQVANLLISAGVANTTTNSLAYLGTITDNGTNTRHIQRYNITTATVLQDSLLQKATWTPVVSGITVTGPGTPTYVSTYQTIGNVVFFTINITTPAGTTTTAVAGTTGFTVGTQLFSNGTCVAVNNLTSIGLGTGAVGNGNIYPPAWITLANVLISGQYFAA